MKMNTNHNPDPNPNPKFICNTFKTYFVLINSFLELLYFRTFVRLWCETYDHSGLDRKELKRQEAIFELFQGECNIVQDLKLAKQV